MYLHIFPDRRKYIGCTSQPVKERCAGGMGYHNCHKMFNAIAKFGWDNIDHYVLMDGLCERYARLMKAALIKKWSTHKSYGGYNMKLPSIDGLDSFVIPEYKKRRMFDGGYEDVSERIQRVTENRKKSPSKMCKRIRLVETGEEFPSLSDAAEAYFVTVSALCNVVGKENRTCGTCTITDPDEGWTMEVRAHWVYVE